MSLPGSSPHGRIELRYALVIFLIGAAFGAVLASVFIIATVN